MIPVEWLGEAQKSLATCVRVTPFTFNSELDAYFKWENHQITGSFKLRGALNKVLSLQPWEKNAGFITASAGNHGQGVAYAAREAKTTAVIFASDHAVPAKIESMRKLGAEVRLVAGGYAEAEETALNFAAQTGKTWISPYNDARVIAGQATIGYEMIEQLGNKGVKSVVVPVGGGGLITGIALALRSHLPGVRIIGVQSEASSFLHALFHGASQESVVEWDSLADGLAGKLEDSSITIPAVRELVDDFFLVTEDNIREAIRYAWETHREVIEGSGAVSLAAVLSGKIQSPSALVITGGNIQQEEHQKIIGTMGASTIQGGNP